MRAKLVLGAFAAVLAVNPAHAQNAVNVSMDVSAPDVVGRSLVANLRDDINRSTTLTLVYGKITSLNIKIVTLNPDNSDYQNQTIYSLVITFSPEDQALPYYLDNSVGVCGRQKLQECSTDIFGQIDGWADSVRKIAARDK